MKEVKYKCNMCLEIIANREDILCMKWKTSIFPQAYVITDEIDASDKHICTRCLALIGEFYATTVPSA
jgi:hypothetical protein